MSHCVTIATQKQWPSQSIGASLVVNYSTPEELRLKDEFIAAVGHWPECGDAVLKFAPEFIDGFLRVRSGAWNAWPLEPKVKELVGLAINALPTSLHEAGVRGRILRALQHGASPGEISEMLQRASGGARHDATATASNLRSPRQCDCTIFCPHCFAEM